MNNDNKKTVAIIGAGPAGLACAYELIKKDSSLKPIIIEKLDCVGGISRTVYKNGLGVDIGGHRLFTNDKYIQSIWDSFLEVQSAPSIDDLYCNRQITYPKIGKNPNVDDDVMLIRQRFSSIIYNNKFFTYPLQFNLKTFLKLGFWTSFVAGMSYIKSIFCKREEKNLEDFMINRFGQVLYNIFFKDYTKKVWGVDASVLSCEWGHQRIRKLSLFKTIINSIFSQFKFLKIKKETSLIDEFYYPKFGCSQLWDLMAKFVKENGGEIILESEVEDFNVNQNKVLSLKYRNNSGEIKEIIADYFVSSMPIKDLMKSFDAPLNIKQSAINLPYRDYILASFHTDAFNLKNTTQFKTVNDIAPDCWIYLQEKGAIAARIQIMNNWSPYLVGDFKKNYLISLEYFLNETDDFWKQNDEDVLRFALSECEKYNLFSSKNVLSSFVVREKKAYPAYFGTYKDINNIKEFLSEINNLFLIGRNGQHKYNNMDEAMLSGIEIANKIIGLKNDK